VRIVATIFAVLLALPAYGAETPRRGGILTFAVTLGEPDTYDCHAGGSSAVLTRVAPHYSLLIKLDPNNYPNVTGDAAESWTVSSDGLTYSFKLHPGIKFHDGTTLTAADAKASYERIIHPPTGVVSYRKSLFADVAAIEVPDDRIIVFKLAKPNPSMLTYFAAPTSCLYSAKKLAEDPDYPKRAVMGTGPFRFVRHVVGSEWVGERFDGYFQPGKPYLDGFRVVDMNIEAAVNAMASGQIATDFRGLTLPQRDRIVAARGDAITTGEADQAGGLLITFNARKPPFDDARVRRALSLAIDRWGGAAAMERLIIFSGVNGFQRIGTPFGRTKTELEKLPGFRPDMAANRDEARRLLAEAGQQNLSFTLTSRPQYTPLGVYLIDQWRQIGVSVTQDLADTGRFFAGLNGGNFEAIITGGPDYVDDPSLQLVRQTSRDVNPTNQSFSVDRKVDALYEQQARELDFNKRKQLVQQLEAFLLQQSYSVPLFWAKRYHVMDARYRGYVVTPSTFVGEDLADVWMQ
jgi:peptide/nickel transport system substrate-binding protein